MPMNLENCILRLGRTVRHKLFHGVLLLATLIVWSGDAAAQQTGRVYAVQGSVERKTKDSAQWSPVVVDTAISGGDSLKTGDASRIAILGSDGIMVRLGPNSLVEFKGQGSDLHLNKGDAHVLSRDPHKTGSVTTTVVSGSIRGTEFAVSADDSTARFAVMEGHLTLANNQGSLTLSNGEASLVSPGKPLTKYLEPKPYDLVRWAFSYPPPISRKFIEGIFEGAQNADEKAGMKAFLDGDLSMAAKGWQANSNESKIGRALISWRNGNVAEALKVLEGINSIDAKILSARILLQGGDVEQSSSLLRSVQGVPPSAHLSSRQSAMIAAQEAISHFVQGRTSEGFAAIESGKRADPSNPELSYADSIGYQSVGDIGNALDATEKALAIEPDNSALLARKAELLFGSGEATDARDIASRAVRMDSTNVDAQIVLGFILLSGGEIPEAKTAFERALELDSNSSKAHLGKGIAEITTGQLDSGRLAIQEAVHLDPRVSLYRSYLGKAFFENEREKDATNELNVAKMLDPNDPTPHLYDAFNHLATFQPILALRSIEDSIARNDNRATYRSRLLLDQDHATRSSGLGKIFSAIDFVRPGQIEALKGLTEDPSNYSAHFLYKDALVGQSFDSAIISSEATGTLLAPAGFSALLPSASSGGSLNEYTTLFERSQSRTGIDTVVESKERRIDGSIVHFSGSVDKSYLLNYGTVYADGYRDDDYIRRNQARALGQYDITPEDKLLLEWIGIWFEQGDTSIDVDPETNDPDSDFSFEDYSARLGWRRSWSSNSKTLFQALFINSHFNTEDLSQTRGLPISVIQQGEEVANIDDSGIFTVHSRARTRGSRFDLQQIYNAEEFSLVAGVSSVFFRERQRENAELQQDDLGIFEDLSLDSRGDVGAQTHKGYAYLTLKPDHWIRFVGGAAYSSLHYAPRGQEPFSDETQKESQWTPKAGIFLTPSETLTFRGAYFETLGSSSIRELESIEPVQVAGLRQLYDDPVATFSRNWAVGVDWKEPKSTYIGTEFLLRNLSQPGYAIQDQFTVDADTGSFQSDTAEQGYFGHAEERTAVAYINQVVSTSVVASLEYDYTRSEDDLFEFETNTHRTRAGLTFFDSSGLFTFASATHRHQDRDNYEPEVSDASGFWIASGGIGYQLPHRKGAIQLAVQNIFDREFRYVPTSQDTRLLPGANFTLGITVNF